MCTLPHVQMALHYVLYILSETTAPAIFLMIFLMIRLSLPKNSGGHNLGCDGTAKGIPVFMSGTGRKCPCVLFF